MQTRILASFRDAFSSSPSLNAQPSPRTVRAGSSRSDKLLSTSGVSKRGLLRAGLALLAARGALAAPVGQRPALTVRASTLTAVGDDYGVVVPEAKIVANVFGQQAHRLAARATLSAADAVSRIAELAAQINALQAEIATANPGDVVALQAKQLELMQEQSNIMTALQSGGDVITVSLPPAPTTSVAHTVKPAPTTQAAPTVQPAPTTQAVPTSQPASTARPVPTSQPAPTTQAASAPMPAPAPGPVNLTGPEAAQWQAAVQGELQALQGEQATSSTIAANYAQAGIKVSVGSALPPSDPATILNDSLAQAAEAQMQANYAALGSMDLTEAQIGTVYASAMSAAEQESGVPAQVLTSIVWTESKGHPLTSNGGLGQIDPVAWGQMADANPALSNRYNPADNIMAAAMYMAAKAGTPQPATYDAWMAIYHADYQG